MLKLITLVVGTAVLAFVSRASLRVPRSHGFYRFFAWELILVLIVLNTDGWFDAPLTFDQIVGGILMNISLVLVIIGYLSLRQFGKRDENRKDAPLLLFEKTTVLVTRGIYRYIRHPMYSSLMFLNWGLFFSHVSWLSASVAIAACAFLVITTLAEEAENIRYFGAQYQEYMKRSRLFVPFLL